MGRCGVQAAGPDLYDALHEVLLGDRVLAVDNLKQQVRATDNTDGIVSLAWANRRREKQHKTALTT